MTIEAWVEVNAARLLRILFGDCLIVDLVDFGDTIVEGFGELFAKVWGRSLRSWEYSMPRCCTRHRDLFQRIVHTLLDREENLCYP